MTVRLSRVEGQRRPACVDAVVCLVGFAVAQLLIIQKDLAAAEACIAEAIQVAMPAFSLMSDIAATARNPNRAVAFSSILTQLAPSDGEVLYLHAQRLGQAGNWARPAASRDESREPRRESVACREPRCRTSRGFARPTPRTIPSRIPSAPRTIRPSTTRTPPPRSQLPSSSIRRTSTTPPTSRSPRPSPPARTPTRPTKHAPLKRERRERRERGRQASRASHFRGPGPQPVARPRTATFVEAAT